MKRREVSIFNLSFLDVISCGFGAVILLFVMINARSGKKQAAEPLPKDLSAETRKIEREILQGKKDLLVAKNSREILDQEQVQLAGKAAELLQLITSNKVELAHYENSTLATRAHINKLKADIQSREEDKKRLEAGAKNNEEDGGDKTRSFKGEGDRQYLTGLKVGGDRILILIDSSASMLSSSLVDIIRLRNMSEAQRRSAHKWRRAVRTVDWLSTQLPQTSQFQILHFNESAEPVLAKPGFTWLDGGDAAVLNEAVGAVEQLIPDKGTSLLNAFAAVRKMNPPPDNIILITDGLPTIGDSSGFRKKISGSRRLTMFNEFLAQVNSSIPVNVILFPMEGDPLAAGAFWRLVYKTKGSYIAPSEDWP